MRSGTELSQFLRIFLPTFALDQYFSIFWALIDTNQAALFNLRNYSTRSSGFRHQKCQSQS